MNREEALEDFNKNAAYDLVLKCKKEFEKNFNDNEEKTALLLIDAIKKLNKKAIENRNVVDNYTLGVLQFELLRSNILNESYKIHLHGYNSLWYLDDNSIYEEIDLKFLFKPFENLRKELIENSRKYIDRVNIYDIQKIIFDAVSDSYMGMSKAVREYLWDLDEEEWINEMLLSDFYIIKWSEYKGKGETVFAMDMRKKTTEDLENMKKEKKSFIYSVWRNSCLENADLSKRDLLFINFKESALKNLDFSSSNIISGEFKSAKITKCNFEKARVVGTELSQSDIKECKFKECDLRSSDFNTSILNDVDFSSSDMSISNFVNSKLNNVSFKGCNLLNSDFTNAVFENVSFQDADLKDSIFSRKDIPFLHLSPEQLQDVFIGDDE